MVILKVMSTWKPALLSAAVAVAFMVHCKNAEVQLQLVKLDGSEAMQQEGMRDKQASVLLFLDFQREFNKVLC